MTRPDAHPPHTEREATLLVVSSDPARTLQRIAALRELAGYELKPRGRESLRDAYLDTPDGLLSSRRIALRTRAVGDRKRLVTLKGPSIRDRETGAARPEFEFPASARSVARIRDELERMGVKRGLKSSKASSELAQALGLVEVQRRITHRTVRDVVPAGSARKDSLAELALDSVTYQFGDREVRLFEIEIEAKRRDGGPAVEAIRNALLEKFGDELRPWSYSKLATGKAMERRARLGKLSEWLGRGARLKPSAVPRLARALARA